MTNEIQNAVDIIIENTQPDKIILFGSRVKNNNNEISDYDICILKKDVINKRQLSRQLYRLLYKTKLAIDIIIESPEKFLELKNIPYLIYHDIFQNGQIIYEKK